MAKSTGRAPVTASIACATILLAMLSQQPASVTAAVDNVAFQWSNLYNSMFCAIQSVSPGAFFGYSIQPQLHLAQWHALLALKSTGDCTTEEAVVAYASHKILAHYFPYNQDAKIAPLLERQLRALRLSKRQQNLAKRLGEAVAASLLLKRSPAGDFARGAVKEAMNRNLNPKQGIFRYFNNSRPAREAQVLVLDQLALYRPFVIPDPLIFARTYLADLKPPAIPSPEWNFNYDTLKDIGRKDFPGRTPDMDLTANLFACSRTNTSKCGREQEAIAAAQSALPSDTSLSACVELLAKMSISLYDVELAFIALKYGFWFWRPVSSYRAGDVDHAPIPTWTPYVGSSTPPEPEYPSGAVSVVAAGARSLEIYLKAAGLDTAFSLEGAGTFTCDRAAGVPILDRKYSSLRAFVDQAKIARMYAGVHYNVSVEDGEKVGFAVADYVDRHWKDNVPSGALPDSNFMDIHVKVPHDSGKFSPIKFDI